MSEDYLNKSRLVKERATEFIEKHSLIEILKEFGEPHFTGSYELDLMNRQDIDVVLVVHNLSFTVVADLAKRLNTQGFNKYWIFDNSDKGFPDDPKHIVCEATFGAYNHQVKEDDRWDVGISVCEEDQLNEALKLTHEVANAIEENEILKELIVKLKFELAEKNGEHKYRGKAVYDAVLKHKAKTVEDVENLDTNNY